MVERDQEEFFQVLNVGGEGFNPMLEAEGRCEGAGARESGGNGREGQFVESYG